MQPATCRMPPPLDISISSVSTAKDGASQVGPRVVGVGRSHSPPGKPMPGRVAARVHCHSLNFTSEHAFELYEPDRAINGGAEVTTKRR
jgi:hypothetical protein